MRLKILSACFSNARGGMEIYSVLQARAQAARGHRVLFLCQRGTRIEEMAREAGLEYRAFSYRPYTDLRLMAEVRRTVTEEKFDVVHSHKSEELGVLAPALWRLRRIPLFFTLHMNIPGPKKDLYHRLEYGRVDKILANGALSAESARRNLPVPPEKVMEVPLGFDVGKYSAERNPSLRRSLGIADDALLLGILSRLEPLKGQMDAVQAMPAVLQKFPKAELLLVGDETAGMAVSEKGRLEQEARALGAAPNIRFLPFRNDVPEVLRALDVFLLPSHFETYSISLIEAKLCAVPVVAAASGGVPQNMGNGAFGLLVPPKDPAALARGIIETLSDIPRAKGRAGQGRRDALARHDMEKVLDIIDAEYARALGRLNG